MFINLPPGLEKLLARLGVNTGRLKWKLHFWEQKAVGALRKFQRQKDRQRYKSCQRCRQLALADDKICKCGEKLPSYIAYQLYRLLGFQEPGVTPITLGFLSTILMLYCWQVWFSGGMGTMFTPNVEALLVFGAYRGDLFQAGAYWQAFTSGLCHFGPIHVLFNVIAISQMLPQFEEDLGPWIALLIITLTQIGSTIADLLLLHPYATTAGASGIAFGLIGFGIAFYHRQGIIPVRNFYLHWCLYGFIFGLLIGANHVAHAGGLIAGLLLGIPLAERYMRERMKTFLQVAGMLCLLPWLVSLGFLLQSIWSNS